MTDLIDILRLEDGDHAVSLLSYGLRLQSWNVTHGGAPVNVVLGHADPRAYLSDQASLGAVVGRVANRISGGGFTFAGRHHTLDRNDGPHTLHGGARGFAERHWQLEGDGARAGRFTLVSEDGDMGFPGRVMAEVLVSLAEGWLTYDMTVHADQPTPVNLAQHAYWNLNGHGDVLDHQIRVDVTRWTPTNDDLIPTGVIAPLSSPLRALHEGATLEQAAPDGLDLSYVLDHGQAKVTAPSGLCLKVETDQPCLQLYTGHMLDAPFERFGGLCLEPQGYVDACNQGFPLSQARPDQPYRQVSRFFIGAA